jgi:hypothetical protein
LDGPRTNTLIRRISQAMKFVTVILLMTSSLSTREIRTMILSKILGSQGLEVIPFVHRLPENLLLKRNIRRTRKISQVMRFVTETQLMTNNLSMKVIRMMISLRIPDSQDQEATLFVPKLADNLLLSQILN